MRPVPFSIGITAMLRRHARALEVGMRRVDIAYVNPSAMVAMPIAARLLQTKMECACWLLSVLGPHRLWCPRICRQSIADIVRRKIPLHVSTACPASTTGLIYHRDDLGFYGFSSSRSRNWAARQECARPFAQSDEGDQAALADGDLDEGVSTEGGGWIWRWPRLQIFPSSRRSSKSSKLWATAVPCCRRSVTSN